MGRLLLLVAMVGCYSPTFKTGAPCETDRDCPSVQRCVANTCGGSEDVIHDAPPADTPDLDAPMLDAMVDALVIVSHTLGDDGDELRDAEIWGDTNELNTNFGGGDHMSIDGDASSLVRFDLSSIATDKTVTSAELTIRVTDFASESGGTITIHRMRETWIEAEATFLSRATGTAWMANGAAPPSGDAAAVASVVPMALDTNYTVDLPNDLVQDWIDTPSINYGLVIRRGTSTEHVHLGTREGGTNAKLTVEVY